MNAARRKSFQWIGLLALVGLVGFGGWAYRQWFSGSVQPSVPPELAEVRSRLALTSIPTVRFRDITEAAGIRFRHFNGKTGRKLLPETMGSGVAFFDFDVDGHIDLLFVNSCPWPGWEAPQPKPTLAVYRNRGDGTFDDVTVEVGLDVTLYGMGVTAGDYDNDGFPDVFISCVGKHRLFHNEQGKRFVDVTDLAGVGGPGDWPKVIPQSFYEWGQPIPFGASAAFLDYDGDGKLDLFVTHYVTWSPKIDLSIDARLTGGTRAYVKPQEFEGAQCVLYRNVDGRRFVDVSKETGIEVFEREGVRPDGRLRAVGKALGVIVCDPDEDGWPDIVVANDTVRNFFFHNVPGPNGSRIYREIGLENGIAYAEGRARGGMGIDYGEYRPGKCAVVIVNFANEPNSFFGLDNKSRLEFSDAALSVGLAGPSRGPLKFGAFFFDYDLDGRLDLLTCNGHLEPDISIVQASQTFAQSAQLFWNTGGGQRLFEPVTAEHAGPDLFQPIVGRGSAFADIDGDGDLDVVLTENDGPAKLFRNEHQLGHHWLRLKLVGNGTTTNRDAIGAVVTVEAEGLKQTRFVVSGRGYLSQCELTLTFGLGPRTKVDKVTVRWPGKTNDAEVWTHLAIDRLHVLQQGSAPR